MAPPMVNRVKGRWETSGGHWAWGWVGDIYWSLRLIGGLYWSLWLIGGLCWSLGDIWGSLGSLGVVGIHLGVVLAHWGSLRVVEGCWEMSGNVGDWCGGDLMRTFLREFLHTT